MAPRAATRACPGKRPSWGVAVCALEPASRAYAWGRQRFNEAYAAARPHVWFVEAMSLDGPFARITDWRTQGETRRRHVVKRRQWSAGAPHEPPTRITIIFQRGFQESVRVPDGRSGSQVAGHLSPDPSAPRHGARRAPRRPMPRARGPAATRRPRFPAPRRPEDHGAPTRNPPSKPAAPPTIAGDGTDTQRFGQPGQRYFGP